MKALPSAPRRRRVYIVKNGSREVQPDMWPNDELWADDLTMLGFVNSEGEFVSNPSFSGVVN